MHLRKREGGRRRNGKQEEEVTKLRYTGRRERRKEGRRGRKAFSSFVGKEWHEKKKKTSNM